MPINNFSSINMFAVLDIDECSASSPVCDINANCSNTRGLFVFLDIDECSASSPVCDSNANCSNTRGSYICTCKAGYYGDGKTCGGRRK